LRWKDMHLGEKYTFRWVAAGNEKTNCLKIKQGYMAVKSSSTVGIIWIVQEYETGYWFGILHERRATDLHGPFPDFEKAKALMLIIHAATPE